MNKKSNDPRAPNRRCSNRAEIVECLGKFPAPEKTIDSEGDVIGKEWVFRGLKNSCYELQPTIEREAQSKNMQWPALEILVSSEFKSRAHMHLGAFLNPGDELTWLAQMQHHAIPTRLLDFTYSPFIALYFAIRNNQEDNGRTHVRLWAIDASAVNERFRAVAQDARSTEEQKRGKMPIRHRLSLHPDDAATDRDTMTIDIHGLRTLIAESLSATGTRRAELNRRGSVCAASPPVFNPRLASQQGMFLLNCAEDLNFNESLIRMMEPCRGWCKTFDVDVCAISEIERWLFQMNIHEQSLFPDIEGLAGLIRQKTRLHWK